MPGKDYTDFLERWYYLRPKEQEAKASQEEDRKPKEAGEQELAAESKMLDERDVVEAQESEDVERENEKSRRDQLGPGC